MRYTCPSPRAIRDAQTPEQLRTLYVKADQYLVRANECGDKRRQELAIRRIDLILSRSKPQRVLVCNPFLPLGA